MQRTQPWLELLSVQARPFRAGGQQYSNIGEWKLKNGRQLREVAAQKPCASNFELAVTALPRMPNTFLQPHTRSINVFFDTQNEPHGAKKGEE